ncbi:DNA/RNA non-specific endonuclease [Imhoffiella purpurea]|uniref:Serine protease n=1 Tax=Imhoffiella purpurea TaxID=1249627 RepID=W9VLF6_9GAMM|nr:DNA/RNA non-specific endonuclease [Imhoffiella purpurea]EXJ16932.1 hypothetical protein D779_1755 [Imhoffiella purpurea]
MTPTEFEHALNAAIDAEDLETLEKLQQEFLDDGKPSRPFEPCVRLRSSPGESELEADTGIALANGLSRAIRTLRYRQRRRSGYTGPIIVSEGDSWFQYPVRLKDVIDNLSERYAILSLGAAGDTLTNMLAEAEYRDAIAEEQADFFLFSASGNDALGGGHLADLLHSYAPGMEVQDIVRHDVLSATLAKIEDGYQTVIQEVIAVNPRIGVLFHGYDRPVPRQDGRWLGEPMAGLGIPAFLQPEVTGYLIDHLNERLAQLESRFPGQVRHVDCRGRVGPSMQSWYDELHPRNPGYARVADLFEQQIEAMRHERRAVTSAGGIERHTTPMDEVWTPRDEAFAQAEALLGLTDEALIDVRPASQVQAAAAIASGPTPLEREILEDARALRRQTLEPDQDKRLRARRHMVPEADDKAFERILGISNLFPINYLSRGAHLARAVAKIQLFYQGAIPSGSGSGFLVAPGLLLTNNHVLSSREEARLAKAVFDYQENDQFQVMPSKRFDLTGDIFFTSDRDALDFTFVSVRPVNNQGQDLTELGHFTLIEESGKAIKNEPVSIIQHPSGGLKSIALRDSRILGVKGDFIYYTTDTEPGSSGAPVLNDQWLPVALHHRSVPDPKGSDKWIANRGIRISRIFARLREAATQGDRDAQKILALLDADTPVSAPIMPALQPQPLRPGESGLMPSLTGDTLNYRRVDLEEAAFGVDRWREVAGYDPNFLNKPISLPLPQGGNGVREVDGRADLTYMHFSVVMHATRKLPMVTACNVDGTRLKRLKRRGAWRHDPRLTRTEQIGNEAYVNNDYDRGHLVRRVAPMWGSEAEARFAEADTFHYTVCAPQHARLNQKSWLELENYLLDWAEENAARLSIFTGPLFRPDDPLYRGLVQVPADYWKVAIAEQSGRFRAVGYLHTQKNLIPSVEEAFGDYKTHRVPIHILAELSGLDLEGLISEDVAGEGFETSGGVRLVLGREDLGL